ncbi:hypothetical protein NQ317_012176 [Molorchus minor]|uniref:Uncharacterized protein n=1 Tax=Molorchus minor TaxID=1323400 RepID=A0ABQ9K4E1_9CUCU|nr:hypothetical protein NQ317_012176 [Molorchus minor]
MEMPPYPHSTDYISSVFCGRINFRQPDDMGVRLGLRRRLGAAIFLFGGVILLMCDKESEEIYYKERKIVHDNDSRA